MNVTCPNCATIYRVDPAKVPEAGVRARCAVCSAIFPVQREGSEAPRPAPVVAAAPPAPPLPAEPKPSIEVPAPPSVSAPAPPPAPQPQAASAPEPEEAQPHPAPEPARPPAVPPAEPARAGRPMPPRPAMPPVTPAGAAAGRPAPALPPRPAAPAAAAPAAAARRPVNPFLSQDPSQKARRLARALISDMVVYHPAKRREGIRDGTLKQLFEEEIKKSWEEYSEQVGRDVAESSNHFRDALNEILADGRQIF